MRWTSNVKNKTQIVNTEMDANLKSDEDPIYQKFLNVFVYHPPPPKERFHFDRMKIWLYLGLWTNIENTEDTLFSENFKVGENKVPFFIFGSQSEIQPYLGFEEN